jgi:hypothetical protein
MSGRLRAGFEIAIEDVCFRRSSRQLAAGCVSLQRAWLIHPLRPQPPAMVSGRPMNIVNQFIRAPR